MNLSPANVAAVVRRFRMALVALVQTGGHAGRAVGLLEGFDDEPVRARTPHTTHTYCTGLWGQAVSAHADPVWRV